MKSFLSYWITRLTPLFFYVSTHLFIPTFLLALGYFDTYKDVGEWTQAITPCLQVCAGEMEDAISELSDCISDVASQIASELGFDAASLLSPHVDGDSENENSGLPEPLTVEEIDKAEEIAKATKCSAYDTFFVNSDVEPGEGVKIEFIDGIPQEAGGEEDTKAEMDVEVSMEAASQRETAVRSLLNTIGKNVNVGESQEEDSGENDTVDQGTDDDEEPEVPSAPSAPAGRAQNDPFAENSETDENFNNMGEDGLPGKKWTPGTENSIDEAKSANDPLSGWGVQGKDEAAAEGEQTVASTPQNIKTLFTTTASTSVDESRKTEKNALREVQRALEADGQKMELMEAKYATRPTTTKQTENALREVQHALEKEGQKMESAMEARK